MKYILTLFVAVISILQIHADVIILLDNSVKKGKVLRVTETNVEVDPEGAIPFETVPRQSVHKIVYDNGSEVHLNAPVEPKKNLSEYRFSFIGEMGWNGDVGLGGKLNYRFAGPFSIDGGAGIGLWGYRLYGGFRLSFSYPLGFALTGGTSYSTGSMGITAFEPNIKYSVSNGESGSAALEEKGVVMLHAGVVLSFRLTDTMLMLIETGYAHRLTENIYSFRFPFNTSAASRAAVETAAADVLRVIQPGGLKITLGFQFPLS